jgi:hypothetical protein
VTSDEKFRSCARRYFSRKRLRSETDDLRCKAWYHCKIAKEEDDEKKTKNKNVLMSAS